MLPLLTLYLLTLCFGASLTAPPTTKSSDCTDTGVRALLKRLEILEKLVRDIKGQCTTPCCSTSQTGADDPSSLKSPPCPQELEDCPGGCGGDSRGVCVDGQCQCKDGYMGDRCQLQTCPEDCNDQGRCVKGRCICFEGYFGLACGSKTCPNNCYNQGQCEDGVCVCDYGFSGLDCSARNCPNNCLNRGKCEDGVCVCDSGFSGVDCGSRPCPRDCLNQGRCENGVCVCQAGFSGVDCSTRLCPRNCQQQGRCKDGVCVCNPGFTGSDCSSRRCPSDCHENGRCEDGACICNAGFSGFDCSSRTCPEDCNEQGQCVSGICVCDPGFIGDDCGTRICSEECEKHGRCEDGECVCDPGYTGTDCEIRTCPSDCHNQGRCEDGKCVCDTGYTGSDCSSRACPNKCNNRGRCQDGICVCNSGFSGSDCGTKTCPKDCSGNGQCVNGKCICDPGFAGPVCGARTCPAGCARHGRCVRGVCVCSPGFTGPDCGSKTCPKNCLNRGRCEDGNCVCDSGYTGLDCGSRTCPNDCYGRGQCDDGVCVCDYGYTGLECGSRTCPNDCNNRGQCEDGVCVCDSGYTGLECQHKTCPNDCNDRGQCDDGVCVCDSGYTGLECQHKTCPNDCNNRGQCEDGECICDSGYTDLDCGTKTCPGDCQNHGRCNDGECICDSGYGGVDCGTRTCPNDCNNRGRCDDGLCICDSGFNGPECESKSCPNDCNNRGQCENGVCMCDSLYAGLDCGSRSCPNNCQNHGRCDDGTCVCYSGYAGVDCSSRSCPDKCQVHGRCEDGVCVCNSGYTGPDCGSKACPKNCNNKGQCLNGKCVCDLGFAGPVCGSRSCPGNCNGRGKCINGICMCKKGYGGADCRAEDTEITAITGLRVTSQEESSITIEWDQPQILPDTYEISFKAKKENGLISNTVDGSLTTFHQTGLAPGQEYTVTVQPRKQSTAGPDTSINATTRIEKLHGLQVVDISTSSFLLRWDRPQTLPDRYIVTVVTPSGKERRLKVAGRGDRVRVTGLEEATIYRVILRAESGREQSEGVETTVTTAFTKERIHPDVEDEQRMRGAEVTLPNFSRSEKAVSAQAKKQNHPTTPRTTLLRGQDGEGSDNVDERQEVTTEDGSQKGTKIIHKTVTSRKSETITIHRYRTIYHEDGSVTHVLDETEDFDDKTPQHKPIYGRDQGVMTSATEKGELGDVIETAIRETGPEGKMERWIVTTNISHSGSPQRMYPFSRYTETGESGLTKTSHTSTEERSDGSSTKSTASNSDEEGISTHFPQKESPGNKYIHSKLKLSGEKNQSEPLSQEEEPGTTFVSKYETAQSRVKGGINITDDPTDATKSRQIIKTVHRVVTISTKKNENRNVRNETKVHEDSEVVGEVTKRKNQTKVQKAPFFSGSQLKAVIDNLPEKLSPFNGTFIQRLESYLRATSYPLKANQTVESVAKAIFLYLVKWKPHNFTGMVYDRLPQKTPGATGNPEPVGASRLQGNVGRTVMENNIGSLANATDEIEQTSALVAKGKTTRPTEETDIHLNILGRVEALGEIDIPMPEKVQSSIEVNRDGLKIGPTPEEYEKETNEEDFTKTVSNKSPLDKIPSSGSHKAISPAKKKTPSNKKKERPVDEKKTPNTDKKENRPSDAKVKEYGVLPAFKTPEGTPKSYYEPEIKKEEEDNSPISSSHPKHKPGAFKEEEETKDHKNYESKKEDLPEDTRANVPEVHKKNPNINHNLGPIKRGEEQGLLTTVEEDWTSTHSVGGSLPSSETREDGRSPLQGRKKESEGTATEQDAPLEGPFTGKVPGTSHLVGPTILQRNPTSLIISLEGLGVLWDKVIVIYQPLPSNINVASHKLEVERGATEVEIGGLEPGTHYRIDLHGMVKGHSSKSYSLVADRAMSSTTVQADVKTTTPHTEEGIVSKAPPVTQKPQGLVAQMGALQVREVTSDTITLLWKAKPRVFESFLIRYEDVTDSMRPLETSVTGDQREVTLTDLNQNTRYAISVHGVKGGKLSRPLKEEVTTESAPDRGTPPRLAPLSVSDIQTNSFLLWWEPLDGDFDAYIIQYGPPGGPLQEDTLRGDQTSYLITGLRTAVNYTVEVRGMWGDQFSEVETTYVLTDKPKPGQMKTLSVSDVRSESVHLTWEVQGGEFDSFLLYYRDGSGKPHEVPLAGDLRSFTVGDLNPGKKYKFVVYGIKKEKRSKPVTAEAITDKAQPPRLESLSVSDVRSDSIRLEWDVQAGEFDSFLLYFRDATGKPKEITLESGLRTVEVNDLRPGKKYKFVLHGVSEGKKGKGVIAETTTATIEKPTQPSPASPSAPHLVDLQASEVLKDSARLSWTVEGELSFDWIVVQYREPEGGVRELQIPGGDISTVVSGLLPSRRYKFNVYGVRGEKRSKPLSTEIETGYPEVLGQPSSFLDDLYIATRGPHSIILSWEAPDDSFDSFIVRYGVQGQETLHNEVSTDGSTRTLAISDLQPDTLYAVTLHGIRGGKEQGSLKATGRTAPLDLKPPRNLRFSDTEETSVVVNWDPPNPETTTFKVSYQVADGGEPESVSVVGSSTTLKGLMPGMNYEVAVVSVRGFEESQPLIGYITTVGGGPRSLRAFDVTEVSALLRWEAPLGHVDTYLITYTAENVPSITMEVPGHRTELQLSSLHPHTEYSVSVQSIRGSETSSPTSTSFTTSADTPRDLSASQITARSALLTWKAPQATPDGYQLMYHTPAGEMKEIHLLHNLTSYTMIQLTPLSQYRVQLHALHGGVSSAPISTSFTTGRVRFPYPRDCWEQRMNGELQNGLFTIHLGGDRVKTMPVYCDMETDGGGWIVFQRRMDGSTDFYRAWNEYKRGFGNLTSEFWLGLIALHQISSSAPFELRVDLRAGNESAYAFYEEFLVEAEDRHFRIRLGNYRGDAGDSLSYHNNMIFSTRDRDAQRRILPCAVSYHGAWWYRNCHYANLNGQYSNDKDHQGVNWFTWKGFEFSIPFTEMKMRPRGSGSRNRL
ncbi:tenascin-X [Pelodytes ibericus]